MYKNIVQIPSFLHVYTSERTEQNAPQRNLSCAFKSWKQRSTGKTVSFRTATAVPYVQKKNTNTHTYTQTQIEHTHTHTSWFYNDRVSRKKCKYLLVEHYLLVQ